MYNCAHVTTALYMFPSKYKLPLTFGASEHKITYILVHYESKKPFNFHPKAFNLYTKIICRMID